MFDVCGRCFFLLFVFGWAIGPHGPARESWLSQYCGQGATYRGDGSVHMRERLARWQFDGRRSKEFVRRGTRADAVDELSPRRLEAGISFV